MNHICEGGEHSKIHFSSWKERCSALLIEQEVVLAIHIYLR